MSLINSSENSLFNFLPWTSWESVDKLYNLYTILWGGGRGEGMNSASTLLVPIKGGTSLAAWVYEEEDEALSLSSQSL